jgi:glycerate-2-kinase
MDTSARQIFLEALEAHHPSKLIRETVGIENHTLSVGEKSLEWTDEAAVYVIAVGKAARPMAGTLKEELALPSSNIICITTDDDELEEYCISASHPVPDQSSMNAADALTVFAEQIPAQSLILFALSGGASSLICRPGEGISLEDIRAAHTMLLESGANIYEMNGVRKHFSQLKGGQLLSYFNPDCTLMDLIISDVPEDNPEIIGSGLTIPDSSTFQDAYDTLLRYEQWDKLPAGVRTHIEKGLDGEVPETLKPGEDPMQEHDSYIIGSAEKFAEKAADKAREKGFQPWVAEQPFNQPVKEVAQHITEVIHQESGTDEPRALLFYGESTVNVTGNGKGGRNQELALLGALSIAGMEDITWLSAGTDGIDGPTDAAGAMVDGETISKAKAEGLDAEQFIVENNSYHFHQQMGTLLKTGPTGNNVMDTTIVLVG